MQASLCPVQRALERPIPSCIVETLLLLRRVTRNSGFSLVSLVAAAAGVVAFESWCTVSIAPLLEEGGWGGETYHRPSQARVRARRCSLRAGAEQRPADVLACVAAINLLLQLPSRNTYVARVAVNNVLTLDGAVVTRSVSVARHCDWFEGSLMCKSIVEM